MRSQKQLYGFIVFMSILTSVVFIYDYLNWPPWKLHRAKAPVSAPEPPANPPSETADEPPPVNYDVRLVSLDFINGKSYTTLVLKREAGQPAPDMIEVITDFHVPGDKKRGSWSNGTRIYRPFDAGERVEITAEAECDWCSLADVPKAGYFADVHVRPLQAGRIYPPSLKPRAVVTAEVPVVVQAKRKPRR